jgi:hypothetical protein
MFLPGTSPFRAKGNVYLGLLESTNRRCPGGVPHVLANLESGELRAFFEQQFLAASRYDILPLLAFSRVAAKLSGMPPLTYAKEGARLQAVRDTQGVYRFLLKLASPGLLAARIPRLYMQYFDFGSVESRSVGDRAVDVVLRAVPEPVIDWLLKVFEGFLPVAMQLAGARTIVAHADPPERDGETRGMPLASSRLHLRWS